jgi:hypothetical protein
MRVLKRREIILDKRIALWVIIKAPHNLIVIVRTIILIYLIRYQQDFIVTLLCRSHSTLGLGPGFGLEAPSLLLSACFRNILTHLRVIYEINCRIFSSSYAR